MPGTTDFPLRGFAPPKRPALAASLSRSRGGDNPVRIGEGMEERRI